MQTLRKGNPELIYVCDPVLGDDGKLYLPSEMVDLYRTELLQQATILTPNQFEAEQLSQQSIQTEHDALQACHYLLAQGPSTVVCTFSERSHQAINLCTANIFSRVIWGEALQGAAGRTHRSNGPGVVYFVPPVRLQAPSTIALTRT